MRKIRVYLCNNIYGWEFMVYVRFFFRDVWLLIIFMLIIVFDIVVWII